MVRGRLARRKPPAPPAAQPCRRRVVPAARSEPAAVVLVPAAVSSIPQQAAAAARISVPVVPPGPTLTATRASPARALSEHSASRACCGVKHLTLCRRAALHGHAAQRVLERRVTAAPTIPINWRKRAPESWLARYFEGPLVRATPSAFSERIEARALATHELGPQPLWQGYGKDNRFGPTRLPNQVRTASALGDVYSAIVRARRPSTIVEFGTAFGVSGMYFLAGLEQNEHGSLFTFEPNELWAKIARENLSAIGSRYQLSVGTFEDHVAARLADCQRIDLAFIDAIHTPAFVLPQLELVLARCRAHALVILDDIHFSSEMRACWDQLAIDARFRASLALGERVGLLELSPGAHGARP
jgi:predicted O-methyltransferase YrrM